MRASECFLTLLYSQGPADSIANFVVECQSDEGMIINNVKLYAWYNRDGYVDHPQPSHSRVLHVQGPKNIMNIDYWCKYFRRWCIFELDGHKIIHESKEEKKRTMEFRFSRIDGQAQTCMQAIQADSSFEGEVWVYYGADPCDPEAEDGGRRVAKTIGKRIGWR